MEVEDFVCRYDTSEVEAYKKVLWRRSHPKEAEEEDRRLAEEEREILEGKTKNGGDNGEPFEDDFGLDDLFDDDEFDIPENERENFSDFFETMTGMRPPSTAFRKDKSDPLPAKKEIKALYRTIVLRLHPDRSGQMTEAMKDLWHETQDAYQRHDINALYAILARCENRESSLGKHSPVSLIRRLTQQLKKTIRSAKHEVNMAKREPAWDYQTRSREPDFTRQIKFEIDEMTRQLLGELDNLVSALSDLDWRASKPTKSSRQRPRSDRRRHRDIGLDLPF